MKSKQNFTIIIADNENYFVYFKKKMFVRFSEAKAIHNGRDYINAQTKLVTSE